MGKTNNFARNYAISNLISYMEERKKEMLFTTKTIT